MDRRGYWRRRLATWQRRLGPGKHFSTRLVARHTGQSQRTIQRRVRAGVLRAQGGRAGEHIRVRREDLLAYLLRREGIPADLLEELLPHDRSPA